MANTVITISTPANIAVTTHDFPVVSNGVSQFVPQYTVITTQQGIKRAYFASVLAAITGNQTIHRAIRSIKTATATVVEAVKRQAHKIVSATSSMVARLSVRSFFKRTMTAGITAGSAIKKHLSKFVSDALSMVVVLAIRSLFKRALVATSTVTAVLVKRVRPILSAATTLLEGMSITSAFFRTLSAGITAGSVLKKLARRKLAAGASVAETLKKHAGGFRGDLVGVSTSVVKSAHRRLTASLGTISGIRKAVARSITSVAISLAETVKVIKVHLMTVASAISLAETLTKRGQLVKKPVIAAIVGIQKLAKVVRHPSIVLTPALHKFTKRALAAIASLAETVRVSKTHLITLANGFTVHVSLLKKAELVKSAVSLMVATNSKFVSLKRQAIASFTVHKNALIRRHPKTVVIHSIHLKKLAKNTRHSAETVVARTTKLAKLVKAPGIVMTTRVKKLAGMVKRSSISLSASVIARALSFFQRYRFLNIFTALVDDRPFNYQVPIQAGSNTVQLVTGNAAVSVVTAGAANAVLVSAGSANTVMETTGSATVTVYPEDLP